ncbi:sodium/glutamate symporter [Corynebacterium sp. 335C]
MAGHFDPYTLLTDVGWMALLLIVGNLLRRFVPLMQTLMIPAPMTAGLLGLILGPSVLGVIPFSDQMGVYSTILIAVVFGALPFSMDLGGGKVKKGARTMWSYSVGMYLAQWGIFALIGVLLLAPLFGTPDWLGLMLPVGFVGGFGVAAAVGGSLEGGDADVAMSLGFTSASVGMLVAIVGGIILSKWGSMTGRTSVLPGGAKLPREMRTGLISMPGDRPSVGRATTSPTSIEPIALHAAAILLTVFVAHVTTGWISETVPGLDIPLFAGAFLVGLLFVGVLKAVKAPNYLDKELSGSISGAATDFLVAYGIASIVPSIVGGYIVPLLILFALGLVFCLLMFFVVAPMMFRDPWLERAMFGWGWTTASVAMGVALLKIVDPKLETGTMEEFGVAYIGFAPFEIVMAILAPIVILGGLTLWLGAGATVGAVIVFGMAWALGWVHPRPPSQEVKPADA